LRKELSEAVLYSQLIRLKKIQAIKDRWAACMKVVRKVKTPDEVIINRHPTQMVNPNKFCSFNTAHFVPRQY
jgi:hypothetical protein